MKLRRTARLIGGVLAAGLLAWSAASHADIFRPAYLQLEQTSLENYQVLWKVPALNETTNLKVRPLFPDGTEETAPHSSAYEVGSATERWQVRVPGGLEGRRISFSHVSETGIDVLVRVERLDGTEQLGRILPADPTFTLVATPGPFEVVRTYTLLGIEHILTGFDHLLFVLALILIVRGTRRLLLTITAFTLAHSITLALATLGVVHIPGPPVEATIALSIVFVAAEILRLRQAQQSLTARKPWIVAFTFGLLHGLGFAGALAEVGLPQKSIPLALLCFNVGVEIGQLLFISAVFALMAAVRRVRQGRPIPAWGRTFASYAIGGMASFWLIERVAAFWN
jgi:hydrogenase/urease accessory protein HupE